MRLDELQAALVRHGVSLTMTEEGKLRPYAAEAPPAELISAIREHRVALLRQIEEGRLPDGRLDVAALAAQPRRCGSCARAVDASEEWGAHMVGCTADPVAWWPLSPPLAVHVGARCGAYLMPGEEVGRGWRAKGDAKAWGPLRPVTPEACQGLDTPPGLKGVAV